MIEQPLFKKVCKTEKEWDSALMAMQFCGADNINKYGRPIEITVSLYKRKRTDQQNRYLFGVVYAIISQETGNEVNDLHEYFLGEFFGWEELEIMGRKRLRPRERSAKQIKARFSEYLEFVISKAAGLGIVIPPPNHDLPDNLGS